MVDWGRLRLPRLQPLFYDDFTPCWGFERWCGGPLVFGSVFGYRCRLQSGGVVEEIWIL